MLDKVFTNNQVTVAGEVVSTFTFSHEVYGEHFFMVNIAVCRLSSSYDIIPVMVSERLVDVKSDYRGCIMQACGQFRSYNRHDEAKNRLVLSVFAREITFLEENEEEQNPNHIFWMAMYVRSRSTVKHRLAERLLMCCLPSTDHMANQIIFRVSAGAEMHVL